MKEVDRYENARSRVARANEKLSALGARKQLLRTQLKEKLEAVGCTTVADLREKVEAAKATLEGESSRMEEWVVKAEGFLAGIGG